MLHVEEAHWCRHGHLGLTHQKMNLDCMLELAAASNRRLQLPNLVMPAVHTHCTTSILVPWKGLYNFSDQPVMREWDHVQDKNAKFITLDTPSALGRLLNATEPKVTLRLGTSYGKYCNPYHFCADNRALGASRRPPLRESNAVLHVADHITARLGGRGAYRALHFRQGDKLAERSETLRLMALSPKELALRMLVLDPPQRRPFSLPLYVATDALHAVRSGCMRACFDVRTWNDFKEVFLGSLALKAHPHWGCPGKHGVIVSNFGVVAVELLLLERARSVVYSDNSNLGREVALRRMATGDKDGAPPVKYLFSMSNQPLPQCFDRNDSACRRPAWSLMTRVAHVERSRMGRYGPVNPAPGAREAQRVNLESAARLRSALSMAHDTSCMLPRQSASPAAFTAAPVRELTALSGAARCLRPEQKLGTLRRGDGVLNGSASCARSRFAALSRCTALYEPAEEPPDAEDAVAGPGELLSTVLPVLRPYGCNGMPQWLPTAGASVDSARLSAGALVLVGDSNDRNLVAELCPRACAHFQGSGDTGSGLRSCACVHRGWRVEWVYFTRGLLAEEGGHLPPDDPGSFGGLRRVLKALVSSISTALPGRPIFIVAQSHFWDVNLWAQEYCAGIARHGKGHTPLMPPPTSFHVRWRHAVAALLATLRDVASSSPAVHVAWRSVPWLPLSAEAYRKCLESGEQCRFQFMPNLADVLRTMARNGKAAATAAGISFLDVARMGARAHSSARPMTRQGGCRETHHMTAAALRGFVRSLLHVADQCWDPAQRRWRGE